MSHRVACRLVGLAITALIIPARGLSAQRCVGTTALVVRDEAGRVMGAEQMKRLAIRSVNGIAPQLRTDSAGIDPPYYVYEEFDPGLNAMVSRRLVAFGNPIVFGFGDQVSLAACGELRELTLGYAGKTMRLLLEIPEANNQYYEIDGPPFQDATFRLRRLRCRDGAQPSGMDDRTTRKCLVVADAWERAEHTSLGHLVARELAGRFVDSTAAACRSPAGRELEAVTRQEDWEATWASYPSVARGAPPPSVDFTTQFVLVVYRPALDLRSIRVDGRGDLTYVRSEGLYEPPRCGIFYLAVDRGGVRSVAGRPLPGAPSR